MAIQLLPNSYKRIQGSQIDNLLEQPTRTYALDITGSRKRIHNIKEKHVDGQEAMYQAIFKILASFWRWHDIYNDQYGFENDGLIGERRIVVTGRIAQRIQDALLADPRIFAVKNMVIDLSESAQGIYHVTFSAQTRFGQVNFDTNIYPWSGKEKAYGNA